MRLVKQMTLLPAFLSILPCVLGQEVHYNYSRGTNFSAYKTYQWAELDGPGGAVPDQLIDQAIKQAVDEQLARKGLTRVEEDGDLKVGYRAMVHEEKAVDVSAFGTSGGPWGGGGLGWGGWASGSATAQTSTIPVGMLMIDLYDPTRKQLIWRGDATKTIDLKKDPDKNYRNLQKAMIKLFKNYPPTRVK